MLTENTTTMSTKNTQTMFTEKFFSKVSKYATKVIGFTAMIAAMATGVGAALAPLGVAGFGSTAVSGISAIWEAVGGVVSSIGSTLGFGSVVSTIIPGASTSAASLSGGISALITGLYALVGGPAAVSASKETKQEKAAEDAARANEDATIANRTRNSPEQHLQTQKFDNNYAPPTVATTKATGNEWTQRIQAERQQTPSTIREVPGVPSSHAETLTLARAESNSTAAQRQ